VADDVAAAATDGPTVAGALVAVARLQRASTPGLAFGASDLERRVIRLMHDTPLPRRGRVLAGALCISGVAALAVVAGHERLHHEVEEVWELAVRR
jgi:hypothetical protein